MKAPRRGEFKSMRDKRTMIREGVIERVTSCTIKIAYSVGGAVAARREMRRKQKNVRIYHCNWCGGYHLTRIGA